MGMYPKMMQPIPYIKHKSKHQTGVKQEKQMETQEKNEKREENKEENKVVDSENQIQEEPKQE